jgi:hypothetical protein
MQRSGIALEKSFPAGHRKCIITRRTRLWIKVSFIASGAFSEEDLDEESVYGNGRIVCPDGFSLFPDPGSYPKTTYFVVVYTSRSGHSVEPFPAELQFGSTITNL